jgi:hypothetical protein
VPVAMRVDVVERFFGQELANHAGIARDENEE